MTKQSFLHSSMLSSEHPSWEYLLSSDKSPTKNLLAFSGGIDSTALFFLLIEKNIDFDLAIVNHNTRKESHKESEYAHTLAKKYNKKIFTKELHFDTLANFEAKARELRYAFFDKIISENKYTTLLTGHQLNDKLEWFFMQLSKGAGLSELVGMEEISQRETGEYKYQIIRPLLAESKQSLKAYLDKNEHLYFVDASNADVRHKRNYFRQKYCEEFLAEFEGGVRNSFAYLQADKKHLPSLQVYQQYKEYFVYHNYELDTMRLVDKIFKKRKILLSLSQKKEILRTSQGVIGGFSLELDAQYIHIAPALKVTIPKRAKEQYRIQKIPPKIRPYLFDEGLLLNKENK